MAQNITLMGASYTDVPSVLLPKTGGGTAEFFDGYSVTYSMNGGAYATATPDTTVAGEGFTSRIKVPDGYMLRNVTVTMGGTDISSSVVTYESEGTSTDTYEVSYNLTNGAYANVSPTTALANEPFSLKLKVPTGYSLSNVSVTMGGVDVTSSVFTYESSSGSTPALDVKTITANGTFLASDDSLDGYSEVTVNVPSSSPTLQSKSVSYTPSTSSQSATITADSGYDGLSSVSVSVGAMATGSASTPATTITANPTISVSSSGSITASASATKSITPTVSAGYVSSGTAGTVTVSGSNTSQLTTQSATTITPTTSSQTAVASGRYTTGAVTVAAIPSQYIVPSGTKSITANGTGIDVTSYASVDVAVPTGGSSMNVQYYMGNDYVQATSYTATDVSLTVNTTGTYKVSWMAWRSTSSGTSGSQMYINGSAYGSANTTFTHNYGQNIILTGVSLSAGDVIVIRARSRSTSYYMHVGNLIIEQTA